MTQRETVLQLLRSHREVTLGMLFEAGVGYTGRNRVAELRREGFRIDSVKGEKPRLNAYRLVSEPVEFKKDQNGQMAFL